MRVGGLCVYLVGVDGLILNFFKTINWGDNVIPRVDDVKNDFILLLIWLLLFRSMSKILIFKGYFII